MSRSILTRLRLGAFSLVLATGTPNQVIDQVRSHLANKFDLVTCGVRKDGERAMAIYIDGANFDGNTDEARQIALSSEIVKAVLDEYSTDKWAFFSAFSALDSKIDLAISGKFLAKVQVVKQFAREMAHVIFGKGGYVAGSTSQTKTLLLFAPDSERHVYTWNYETDAGTVLAQPYGDKMTRYSVAGGNLLAIQAGTGQLRALSFQQIQTMIDRPNIGEEQTWQQALQLKDAQIEDITIGNKIGKDNYMVVATGSFHGQKGMKILNVSTDGGSIRILPAALATIELDEQTSIHGSPVRFDHDSMTFVNRNGGKNLVTRVPLSALPIQVKNAFTPQSASA